VHRRVLRRRAGSLKRGVELLAGALDDGHEGRAGGHVDDARLGRGGRLAPGEGSLLDAGALFVEI
jgi:hypothetical protein